MKWYSCLAQKTTHRIYATLNAASS